MIMKNTVLCMLGALVAVSAATVAVVAAVNADHKRKKIKFRNSTTEHTANIFHH